MFAQAKLYEIFSMACGLMSIIQEKYYTHGPNDVMQTLSNWHFVIVKRFAITLKQKQQLFSLRSSYNKIG